MQKCAVLPGKMQKSGVELTKTNVHVALVKSIRIVAVKTSSINILQDFAQEKNRYFFTIRYKFRYK